MHTALPSGLTADRAVADHAGSILSVIMGSRFLALACPSIDLDSADL